MLAAIVLALSSFTAAPGKGWDPLFPELGNFSRKLGDPSIEKGDKPTTYGQSVTYEWLGGRFEVLTITLVRSPKFKEKYSAEAMKKEKAEKIEINKKTAYVWDRMKADELEKVNRRLVVILADDKVLEITQRGAGLELEDIAKKLNFDNVIKALDAPPISPKLK